MDVGREKDESIEVPDSVGKAYQEKVSKTGPAFGGDVSVCLFVA